MAVVSTFVYLASISEVSKRTIHTIIAIVTALLAETGPTRYFCNTTCSHLTMPSELITVGFCRSKNIGYVIGLGTLGLLVGWALEFFARRRTFSLSPDFHLNLLAR